MNFFWHSPLQELHIDLNYHIDNSKSSMYGTVQPPSSKTSFVQELQLSRLAGEQQMHYYPCTEGVADDVCGCDDRLGDELDRATMVLQICLGQNWLTSVLFQTLLAIIILSFLQAKYRHLSCPDYFTYTGMADQPVDKGVQIIKVAL